MPGIHSDSEMPGVAFRRGSEGDARQGTCYGHRDAKTYNRIKIRATEQDEGRPVVLLHYAQVTNDNRIVRFFVINGHLDPGMKVFSRVDRKSTRLNSSHVSISYAVFCLKKK